MSRSSKEVLVAIINQASRNAEYWIKSLDLSTFPKTGDYDSNPAVVQHLSVASGWRWENWDEFHHDFDSDDNLLGAVRDCEELRPEIERLSEAVAILTHFIEVVGDYTDDFCR